MQFTTISKAFAKAPVKRGKQIPGQGPAPYITSVLPWGEIGCCLCAELAVKSSYSAISILIVSFLRDRASAELLQMTSLFRG